MVKNNPIWRTHLQTPLAEMPVSVLYPVNAFAIMCSKVEAKSDDPLFLLLHKKMIFYKDFQKKLKYLI